MKAIEKDLPRYLLPAEVASLLQISLNSFYIRVHRGQLPVIKLGGSIRVDRYRLEKFLDERTIEPNFKNKVGEKKAKQKGDKQ